MKIKIPFLVSNIQHKGKQAFKVKIDTSQNGLGFRLKYKDLKQLISKIKKIGGSYDWSNQYFIFYFTPNAEKLNSIEIILKEKYQNRGILKQFSKGGLIEGKSHEQGGVKAVIKETNTPIEVEGNEVIINKNTVKSQETYEFEGEQKKPIEILSELNQDGGGVAIYESGGKISSVIDRSLNDRKKPGQLHPEFLNLAPIALGKEINIIMPNGEKHKSSFAIVDIDYIIASHNENTFQSSIGYPLNQDGTNINDRNYLEDVNAQKLVQDYARNLEPERIIVTSRTPSGTPIITKDGIVVSGNNRTMSTKLAVKKYPEKYKQYLDFLAEEYLAFGFDPEKKEAILNQGNFRDERNPAEHYSNLPLIKINNPFLVRIDYDFEEYTTEQLAKYNKDTKKSERPIDKAIKLSQILRNNKLVFSKLSDIIGKYETFTEFYANSNDTLAFAKALIENGILTQQELPAFFEAGTFTEQGKDFIEQMLAAMVLNRDSLLATNLPGVRKYRQTLITSLTVLIANAQLKDGSLNEAINKSIMFAYEMANTNSTLFDILNQQQLFKKVSYNRKAVVLKSLLDAGRNIFKQTIENYNNAIKNEENTGLFGDKLGPEEIFKSIIESKISKQDLMIINNSKLVTDKDIIEEETIDMPPMKDGIRLIDSESIDKLEAYLKKLPQTKEIHTLPGTEFYTHERTELHNKIISEIQKSAVCVRHEKPLAILTGGLPGSGKSTFLKKYSEYLTSDEIFKIDADEIRAKLPEYKGWNADQTHKESSDIVNKLLDNCKKGIPCKYDILYDGTMNKAKNYVPLIEKLKSLGYKTFIIFIEIPPEITRQRVLKRYQETGRYVPRQVIEEGIQKGLSAFDELKKIVDGYMLVDGITMQIIERKGEQLPQDRKYFENELKKNNEIKSLQFDAKRSDGISTTIKILPLNKNKIFRYKQQTWIPLANGTHEIKQYQKDYDISEYDRIVNRARELGKESENFTEKDLSNKIKVETNIDSSKDNTQIQSEIEGLSILLDMANTKAEKKKIQSEIEGLTILLDIEKFEDGGIIPSEIDLSNYDINNHKAVIKRLYDGNLLIDEYKSAFKALLANKESIIAYLTTLKKDDLLKMLSPLSFYRNKNEKKDYIIRSVYDEMLMQFALDSISYIMGEGSYEKSLLSHVESRTQEDLNNFAKEIAQERQKRKEEMEKAVKAIKNPETLDDFKLFIKINGADKLTPEQKIKYDELVSETIKEKRQQEQEQKATIKAVDLGETKMELKETIHTRDKYPLFVVTLSDRVSKEQYQELNSKAKQLGGWYSSFRGQGAIPGFQFKQKEQAEKFIGLKESDISNIDKVEERKEIKTEKKVSKLRENANKMIEEADKELNRERLTNTYKRATQARHADNKAREKKRIAQTMINIADAIENGNVKLLDGVNARTHIELLDQMVRNARRYEIEAMYKDLSYNERESKKQEPATIETIDYLKFGFYPSFYGSSLKDLVNKAEYINGVKRIAGKWDNKLKTFDNDKTFQVTSKEQIDEIIEMFNALPEKDKKNNRIADDIAIYKRLKSMGIENDSMLRAMLREYIQFRGKKQETDRVKELERNLAGRKNIGIDFFPTPKSEAQNMVEIANISEGMDVLEPSAGNGNIAEAIKEKGVNPDVIEISSTLREILEAKGFNLVGNDFMDYTGKKYDRIIMNPPFGHGAESLDIDHVKHAYSLLKPGGRIVAIMGAGTFFRNDKKAVEFREWLDNLNASYEELPENIFTDKTLLATTQVRAYRVIIDNKEPEQPQGGLSDNLTLSDIAKKHNVSIESLKEQLEKGKKVELEHTNDIEKAEKIAMDHLVEMPDYYTKLQKMEQQNPVETYGHTSPSETDKIQSEIEGLSILLDLADTEDEKEKIKAEIEGLSILLDIENI